MSRLILIFGLLITLDLTSSSFAGEFREPTFTIEADVRDRFFIRQINDYYIGNFDDKLPADEVMQVIRDGAFRLSDYFYIEADRYFYFAYYIRNLSGKPQTVYVRWGSQFTESGGYILDHLKNPQSALPLTRFPSDHDVFFGEVPTGDSLIVGFRHGDGTMTGKVGSATIRDLHSMIEITTTEEAINAAVLGVVGIMALYNLGMFLFFRKSYFLYYIIYSIATLTTLSYINGDLIWSVPKFDLERAQDGFLVDGVNYIFALVLLSKSSLTKQASYLENYGFYYDSR
ncbi:7TM diverse intracellular signaling domain-containing protein [Pseudobacteriovorax antillogorgiicola]|uniref:7TM diverse intracellular signalling n=1 Tax=Pseudobacteriovorax antillogorgiicola TaxID=1513793 RepID=A0A1Y6BKS0_9BACT|nr:7TM diverse intracellular signaling domain-containing protein [Pseudobacteriovorax antillogorgiicola]TCS55317.1 7TM protein involved in diverse intracellular signaling [Pseudobacteriovorax antillogorgiicola]SMF14288.1 7TM diverse intracellular signalling [Pseudobacteriovorax antillogorgiicola]